ncbi:MAG: TetR/AcrR family transcriptional regulator [Candidatus Heimdallarchaeota archaeon]|nr:TetR/AcrR family transcriptional regulator [Candidatus Heimdallarchaeota archaeon]
MGRQKQYNRDEKLMQAIQIFWRKGYHNVSVNDLVNALGMGKRSFYQEFVSKEELYVTAIERYASMGRNQMVEIANEDSSLDNLEAAVKSILDITAYDPEVKSCLMSNTALELGNIDPMIGGIVQKHMLKVGEMFASLLDNIKARNEISEDLDSKALGNLINVVFSGAGIAVRGGIPIKDIMQSVDMLFKLIRKS